MAIYEHMYTIDYIDVDENNELTVRNLIKYFQEVGGEHSNSVGYGLDYFLKENKSWLILNWYVKMLSRPHCKDKIIIKTWVKKFEKIYAFREFEVYDINNNLIALASSKWIFKNHASQSIVRISPEIIDAYGAVNKSVFGYELPAKINVPDVENSNFEYIIQRRDIDTNHHVNNLYYIDFAYEALPDDVFNKFKFNDVQVFYKKEIKYKEKIVCCYYSVNDEHIVAIKNEDLSVIHAIIKFKE